MKKSLLLGCAVSLGLAAFAQSNGQQALSRVPASAVKADDKGVPTSNVPVNTRRATPAPAAKTNAVSVITLGRSANAFSNAFGQRGAISANATSNSVIWVHRDAGTNWGGQGSGYVKADASTDGGATWTVNAQTMWAPVAPLAGARYPRAVLFNPPGNTTGANSVIVNANPTLDGSNGSWGGLGVSAKTVGGTAVGTAQQLSSNAGSYMYQIPDAFTVAGSKIFVLDNQGDINATDFSDTLLLTTGTYSGGTFSYASRFIPFATGTGAGGKASIADKTIVFDEQGTVGYIVALTHINFTTDTASSFLPVVMKTTDGGATWSAPYQIDINSFCRTAFNTTNSYSTAFEVAAAVDAQGNCNIFCQIGESAGTFSVRTGIGNSGSFHIRTNGTSVLSTKLVGTPFTLRGTFGAAGATQLSQDTRPCMSRTASGSHLFMTWIQTDTILSGANDQPDLWLTSYEVATGKYTTSAPVTQGTAAEGTINFNSAAPQVLTPSAGTWEIPVSFTEFHSTGVMDSIVTHKYLKGVVVRASDFVGAKELSNFSEVSAVYPNPAAAGVAYVDITLINSAKVSMTVSNAVGQVVNAKSFMAGNGARNQVAIETEGLARGMYFVTFTANGSTVTRKLIVE